MDKNFRSKYVKFYKSWKVLPQRRNRGGGQTSCRPRKTCCTWINKEKLQKQISTLIIKKQIVQQEKKKRKHVNIQQNLGENRFNIKWETTYSYTVYDYSIAQCPPICAMDPIKINGIRRKLSAIFLFFYNLARPVMLFCIIFVYMSSSTCTFVKPPFYLFMFKQSEIPAWAE